MESGFSAWTILIFNLMIFLTALNIIINLRDWRLKDYVRAPAGIFACVCVSILFFLGLSEPHLTADWKLKAIVFCSCFAGIICGYIFAERGKG